MPAPTAARVASAPPRRVRAYYASTYRRRRLVARLEAAFVGFWLGMMDRETLARLDEVFYENTRERLHDGEASYRDDAWNLSGLRDWEAEAIQNHFPAGGRVVVTGAGGGREVIALRRLGFDPIGFEPNADLVRAGHAVLDDADRLRVCARDAFPAEAPPCDALVVGWGSYMLIPGRARRVAFLAAARRHLRAGAPVLLSFFVRAEDGELGTVARVGTAVRRLRRAEPVELGDALASNYVHYFTRAEVEAELAAAGFRLDHFSPIPYGHAVARAT